ncbi:stage II sporulation protein P [Natranaerobius thermophilus]|uniref:Stage II sporulation protein P n=1 Tax=Natranaerobius thermophilus (strain ATCC BAA-1301 / DSM 18059 / JW/NM-WN-LF) TaxID=457570 RepID=B2A4N4_NATTJ|nr:stage II sporulation protein P [Natranaerobius thermophilus]ACB85209.1 stage II sporulation protein P [Natranaerobius thermophilus JW/NM-WN-LF]
MRIKTPTILKIHTANSYDYLDHNSKVKTMIYIAFCFLFLITSCFSGTLQAQPLYEREEGYYTVVDEDDNTILKTGRLLSPGNKYLNQDNELYEITEISEDTAHAEFVEEIELAGQQIEEENQHDPLEDNFVKRDVVITVQDEDNEGPVGIYHSHGAESFVPSEGEESIEEGGGILEVGESMANSIEEENVPVIWSQETHVPHDAGAYDRSRRTVEEIMQENPSALIDVHRDAAPREEYKAEIEGEEGVQVLLVIGQQQQNIQETEEYAQRLKATADEMHPNLVKGILYAEGNYNQDMHPRNILAEIGSQETTREGAEESAELFGSVVVEELNGGNGDDDLNGAAGGLINGGGAGNGGGIMGRIGSSILWIIGAVVLGGIIFVAINAGSFDDIKRKLSQFVSTEFANYLGPLFKTKNKNESNSDQKTDAKDKDHNSQNLDDRVEDDDS